MSLGGGDEGPDDPGTQPQDRRLTPGDIRLLKDKGIDPHDLNDLDGTMGTTEALARMKIHQRPASVRRQRGRRS